MFAGSCRIFGLDQADLGQREPPLAGNVFRARCYPCASFPKEWRYPLPPIMVDSSGGSARPGPHPYLSKKDASLGLRQFQLLAHARSRVGNGYIIADVDPESAAILHSGGLFRHFDNRRQVVAYAGLAPSPWQSDSINREPGVSKAGNPPFRTAMVELAWLWLRCQQTPDCLARLRSA